MTNEFYPALIKQAHALVEGESDMIANMANIAALLYHSLDRINWAGFYIMRGNQLVLGPFQGKPACIRIDVGKGVCGTAVATKAIQRVADVHAFDGHIACDAASNSEIVIPIIHNNKVIAVLDIDSPEYARFEQHDEDGLVHIANLLEASQL